MTRIVHVFSTFDPGGPQVRSVSLFRALPECEHVVVPMDGRSGAAALFTSGMNARVVLPPPEGRKSLGYARILRPFLRELGPDLLVTSNWGSIDAIIASRMGLPFPVVHCEDGFLPDEAVVRKRRRRLTRFVLLNTIHATIVPSRTLLRIARRDFGIASSRLRFIPNGIDLARFRPHRDPAWRRALGIPDDAVVVGSLGSLRPEKDLAVLLRAFARARTPEAWLALAGGGPDEAMLRALARELGIAERVVFAGPIADPAVAYASFDVFAMSSCTEQMPLALLEAMGCGLPAVVTDVGDCRFLVGERREVLAPPRDVEALAIGLSRLLRHPAARAALGRENRARVEREHSVERMHAEWIAVFREALGGASARLSPDEPRIPANAENRLA